jgi:hypothetical protein
VDSLREPREIVISHAHDDACVSRILFVQSVEIFAVERQDHAPF